MENTIVEHEQRSADAVGVIVGLGADATVVHAWSLTSRAVGYLRDTT